MQCFSTDLPTSRSTVYQRVGSLPIAQSEVSGRAGVAGRVVDGAALIMRAVADGGASSAGPMREAALGEGAMLHHLASAAAGKVHFQSLRAIIYMVVNPYTHLSCYVQRRSSAKL